MTIIAPGNNGHDYQLYYIDTRGFPQGGVLDLHIDIPADSTTNGSFDLFPPNASIPANGVARNAVAHRYDVRKGTSTEIEYRLKPGQVLTLGLEGNWFSPKGASGVIHFKASVQR